MANKQGTINMSPEVNNPTDLHIESHISAHLSNSKKLTNTPKEPVPEPKSRTKLQSFRRSTSAEGSICSNEECCGCRDNRQSIKKERTPPGKQIPTSFSTKTRDKSNMRQRRLTSSSSSSCDDINCLYSEKIRNRGNNRISPISSSTSKKDNKSSYLNDGNREKARLRRLNRSSASPVRMIKERGKGANDRLRRRPRTPPSPYKAKEKVPYFSDSVREKDRLRRRYKSPSPVVTSSRQRSSKSRTPRTSRRHRSRSKSKTRSRSRSRHRKTGSERHRHKRDNSPYKNWPTAPQIITIPVPVPDYSFAFPQFHPQHGWPPIPMRPARLPYFSHHRQSNSRQSSLTSGSSPYPPMPPMRYAPPPPYGFNGMRYPDPMSHIRTPSRSLYRYPFT